jgi:hypothetical protein
MHIWTVSKQELIKFESFSLEGLRNGYFKNCKKYTLYYFFFFWKITADSNPRRDNLLFETDLKIIYFAMKLTRDLNKNIAKNNKDKLVRGYTIYI